MFAVQEYTYHMHCFILLTNKVKSKLKRRKIYDARKVAKLSNFVRHEEVF